MQTNSGLHATRRSSRKMRLQSSDLVLIGIAIMSLLYYGSIASRRLGLTTFDDAYMFLRYANNWLAGSGFSWNAADGPSFGITSPLYLIVVTAILGVTNWSGAWVLTGLSFSSGVLGVLMLACLGFLIQLRPELPGRKLAEQVRLLPLLAVPAVVFCTPLISHSFTGMETTLALLLNTLFICALVQAEKSRGPTWLGITAFVGLACIWTRPDAGIYILFLPPLYLSIAESKKFVRALQYVGLVLVGCIATVLAWKLLFGSFLPLPLLSKASGFYEGYTGASEWNYISYMLIIYKAALPFMLAAICIGSLRQERVKRAATTLLLTGLTLAYYSTVNQIMGHNARYYMPTLPYLVFAFYILILPISRPPRESISSSGEEIKMRFIVALMALVPLLSDQPFQRLYEHQDKQLRHANQAVDSRTETYTVQATSSLPQLGWWSSISHVTSLLEDLGPGLVIAASEYGKLGSELMDATIIDMAGLHDQKIASRGFSAEYIISRNPDVIWMPHIDYTGARRGYAGKQKLSAELYLLC